MPLTTTITEDRTIKREQLAFDVSGNVSYAAAIGGGTGGVPGSIGTQGAQGIQGVQGIIGAQGNIGPQGDVGGTGSQGPQGSAGAGLTFPAGAQGRVVYVDGDLTATQQQGFEFNEATQMFTVDSRYSSGSYVVSIQNGAQGIKNADAAPILEIRGADEQGGSPANNHGFSVDYNGLREFGVSATLAKTVIGFDGTTLNRSQFGVYVYDFSTTKTSTFFIHPRYDKRLVYHTGTTGLSTINTVELLTNNVSSAPTDTFGGKVTYALQTGGGSTTTTNAVSHEYLWKSLANAQSQYNLEVRDQSLAGATNDYNALEVTARNTKITGWTSSTSTATNALTLESNMSTASTPTTSSGVNLIMTAKTSTTVNREVGKLEGVWTTAADASRVSVVRLSAYDTTSNTGFEITKNNLGIGSGRTGTQVSPYDSASGTNTSLIIVPKGSGSLIAGLSASGSSLRGSSTIDMSFERGAADVTGGNYTTIVGGKLNRTLSGSVYAGIFAGSNNEIKANVTGGAIIGSDSSLNQNQFSVVVGGASNGANSDYSVVVGGSFNSTGAVNSVSMGKYASAYIPNTLTIASGEYTFAARDFQSHQFVLWTTMNSATWFDLLNDGSAISQYDSSTWMIEALVSGRSSTGLAFAYRVAQAHERNTGTSGQLLGTLNKDIFEETGAGGYDVRFQSVSGQPKLQVLGVGGVFTKVSAFVKVSETRY